MTLLEYPYLTKIIPFKKMLPFVLFKQSFIKMTRKFNEWK